jgi:enamine deaminase RidA (YjgF/YER057c/UK114 family)
MLNGVAVRLSRGTHATRATVSIDGARALEPGEFADRVTQAYQAIESAIAATDHSHVIRWWNGIPGIHDRVDASRDRYMAFNAGRFAAMRRRFGDAHLADEAPAASGVGVAGDALVIHALAAAEPGRSLQNARQRPAVRYSSRFGPLPPCFARATLTTVGKSPTLFISGTAAILGEETVHLGDLPGQLAVTTDHLQRLIAEATLASSIADPIVMRALRIYLPDEALEGEVTRHLTMAFPAVKEIEFWSVDLCRRDLLVEIECIASA